MVVLGRGRRSRGWNAVILLQHCDHVICPLLKMDPPKKWLGPPAPPLSVSWNLLGECPTGLTGFGIWLNGPCAVPHKEILQETLVMQQLPALYICNNWQVYSTAKVPARDPSKSQLGIWLNGPCAPQRDLARDTCHPTLSNCQHYTTIYKYIVYTVAPPQ